jgi:hypothetical protein
MSKSKGFLLAVLASFATLSWAVPSLAAGWTDEYAYLITANAGCSGSPEGTLITFGRVTYCRVPIKIRTDACEL